MVDEVDSVDSTGRNACVPGGVEGPCAVGAVDEERYCIPGALRDYLVGYLEGVLVRGEEECGYHGVKPNRDTPVWRALDGLKNAEKVN